MKRLLVPLGLLALALPGLAVAQSCRGGISAGRDSVTLSFLFVLPAAADSSPDAAEYLKLAEAIRAHLPEPMLASMSRWTHTLNRPGSGSSPLGSETPFRVEAEIQFRLDEHGRLDPESFGSSTNVPPLDAELRSALVAADRAGDLARAPVQFRNTRKLLSLDIAVTTGQPIPRSVAFATWRTTALLIDTPPERIVAPAPGLLPAALRKSDASVGLNFLIDTAGAVVPGSARVSYSDRNELNDWAIAIIERTEYTPALVQGCPVAVEMSTRFSVHKAH